jgi:hypothetical protein
MLLSIVSLYVYIEFHKELGAFFISTHKKYKCKLGYHNAAKSKYYCSDCKQASKKHIKVLDGEGEYKKKAGDFKF